MKPQRTAPMKWPMTLTLGAAILAGMLVTDVYGDDPPRYGHNVAKAAHLVVDWQELLLFPAILCLSVVPTFVIAYHFGG
jgi:hypothetical protein